MEATRASPADRPVVYLHPGQVHASRGPCTVSTVLGSCVSVCLWDPSSRVGGVNHFLLPHHSANDRGEARFSNVAIARLLKQVVELGGSAGRLQAKLFGGACVIASLRRTASLGAQNVDAARRLLADARIPVVAEDVGGDRGRRLLFHTDEGIALVRLL